MEHGLRLRDGFLDLLVGLHGRLVPLVMELHVVQVVVLHDVHWARHLQGLLIQAVNVQALHEVVGLLPWVFARHAPLRLALAPHCEVDTLLHANLDLRGLCERPEEGLSRLVRLIDLHLLAPRDVARLHKLRALHVVGLPLLIRIGVCMALPHVLLALHLLQLAYHGDLDVHWHQCFLESLWQDVGVLPKAEGGIAVVAAALQRVAPPAGTLRRCRLRLRRGRVVRGALAFHLRLLLLLHLPLRKRILLYQEPLLHAHPHPRVVHHHQPPEAALYPEHLHAVLLEEQHDVLRPLHVE
mmetsp:Transcript_16493/g.56186  ORF Transcript_16493/g.56186 Transcript_16493/m.56186 type:complete len:297 (+) Transcript_16493:1078-1968(+)